MVDAGLVVMTRYISTVRNGRWCASASGKDALSGVFVDTPLTHLRGAGSKRLYKKARAGVRNFTGIDSVYEAPEKANSSGW